MTEDNEFENHLRSFRPRAARIELPSIESATVSMRTVVERPYGALIGSWACGALVGAVAVLLLFQFRTEDKTELAIYPANVELQGTAPSTLTATLPVDGSIEVARNDPAVREMEMFLSNDDSMDDMPLVAHFSFQKIGSGKFVANQDRSQGIASYPQDMNVDPATSLGTSSEQDTRPSTRGSLMRQWMNDPSSGVF